MVSRRALFTYCNDAMGKVYAMREYTAILMIAFVLTLLGAYYVTNHVASAMDNSANLIAQAHS